MLSSSYGWAQGAANACDLNADGTVNVVDVQLGINMDLGLVTCTANIEGADVCNGDIVNRIVTAALGGTCLVDVTHNVTLNWTASASSNVVGYNVYRGTVSGGPYTKVTSSPTALTNYTDNNVVSGQTYYYVATAVDNASNESGYSSQAQAVIPTP